MQVISIMTYSQGDTLNRYNAQGKKDGIWIQYLDSLIIPTTKSKAKYFRYVTYHNGSIRKNFLKGHRKKFKRVFIDKRIKLQNPLPLDGKYVFERKIKDFSSEFKTERLEETYSNGFPVLFQQYYDDHLYESIDFRKLYKGIRGTLYFSTGLDSGFYRQGHRGWRFYSE